MAGGTIEQVPRIGGAIVKKMVVLIVSVLRLNRGVEILDELPLLLRRQLDLLPIDGKAESCDVIANPPSTEVDLALVLKTIPCLEQVDKQAGERLLENLKAKHILVSFPAKSLGGRDKGMRENYEARFNQLVAGKDWAVERFEFETELAYLIRT